MSAPAPDQTQRAAYAPADATSSPQAQAYQYVTPQPVQYVQQQPISAAPGVPGTEASPGQQYVQAIPGTPGVQYVQPGNPGIQYVQPGTPGALYAQPGTPGAQYAQPVQYVQGSPEQGQPQMLQQPFYPQSPAMVAQPAYTTGQAIIIENQATPAYANPAVTIVSKPPPQAGLAGRLPFFKECCFCVPLHAGGMTVCGLMILFYGITGLLAVLSSSLSGFYSAISIVIGVIYLLIAFASCFGFAGIYKEKREWVDKYVLFFIIGSFLWLVLEIIDLIIQIVYINNLKNNCLYGFCYYSFNPGPWIAVFLIGLFFQIYFCSILASYQRVLHARTDAFEGKEIMMH